MSESQQTLPNELESDEFVVLVDNTAHLVYGFGLQISLAPSMLFLTNRKILVKPSFGTTDDAQILLNDITHFQQKDINDCKVLIITGRTTSSILRIFIPDNVHQLTFADILSKLLTATDSGAAACDSLALSLQRFVKEASSLDNFYSNYPNIKDKLSESPTPETTSINSTEEILSAMSPEGVHLFGTIIDVIKRSEILFFAILGFVTGFLSLLFSIIPFGACATGLACFLIVRHGFQLIFGKLTNTDKQIEFGDKLRRQFGSYISAYEKFRTLFQERCMWKNPRKTMEVAVFFLSSAFMFFYFDPAFIFAISLFGLAFVERWDPVGLGCLGDMFNNLITFK